MTFEEVMKKAQSFDNEDLRFELKQSKVLIDKNNKFDKTKILRQIAGMANREGGVIVIGVNDDGTPEGLNVFDRFKDKNKTGVDKIKELIINLVFDKVSPSLDITIEYMASDESEFIAIYVPKRKSIPHAIVKRNDHVIKERMYYIKTSHSVKSVSDGQLEWLFSNPITSEINKNFTIEVNTYKNFGGIPLSFSKFADRFIMQPAATRTIGDFIREISDEAFERCKSDLDYRSDLLIEMLMYSIVLSLNGNSRIIPKDSLNLPLPTNELKLSVALSDKIDGFFNVFYRKLNCPRDCLFSVIRHEREISFSIKNRFFSYEMILTFSRWQVGLFGTNPYWNILIENHGREGQDILTEHYDSTQFILNTNLKQYFPEKMDSEYYDSEKFFNSLNNYIEETWDINYFMKNYPHYRALYSIEYKMDAIIQNNRKD